MVLVVSRQAIPALEASLVIVAVPMNGVEVLLIIVASLADATIRLRAFHSHTLVFVLLLEGRGGRSSEIWVGMQRESRNERHHLQHTCWPDICTFSS